MQTLIIVLRLQFQEYKHAHLVQDYVPELEM